MKAIHTNDAPAPAGHYAQALKHNGLIYVSGQLPIDPHAEELTVPDIETQTRQALRNVEAILKAAGSDLGHLLQVTIYLSDEALWERVNAVYAHVLGAHRPARAVVPVKELHYGFQIEIQAIAAVPE